MDFGADFDEDLFDTKPRRKQDNLADVISNYKVKEVSSRKFLDEMPTNTDELANWLKMRGDLGFFEQSFELALDFYQKSLEMSKKSTTLNEGIFRRELTESVARCLIKLSRFELAQEIVSKLEESAGNYEQLTTSLNLHLALLQAKQHAEKTTTKTRVEEEGEEDSEQKKQQEKEENEKRIGLVICKLILLHPMSTHFWRLLTDHLIDLLIQNNNNHTTSDESKSDDSKELLRVQIALSFCMTREFGKFGSSSKNAIYLNYRDNLISWISDRTRVVCSLLSLENADDVVNLSNRREISCTNSCRSSQSSSTADIVPQNANKETEVRITFSERLEKLDKWEDNVKLKEAQQLDELRKFFTLF